MTIYENKQLQKYSHTHTEYPQHVSFPAQPLKYSKVVHEPKSPDMSQ